MFWNRILPEGKLTLGEAPAAHRPGRGLPAAPSHDQIKLDMQMATMEAAHEQRREQLRRRAFWLKAAAWTLTYISAMATIWAVLRVFG